VGAGRTFIEKPEKGASLATAYFLAAREPSGRSSLPMRPLPNCLNEDFEGECGSAVAEIT